MLRPNRELASGKSGRFLRWLVLAIVVGTFANVCFAIVTTDADVWRSVRQSANPALLIAAALALVPWVTDTIHTYIWVRFVGARVGVVDVFRLVLATQLASSITPTAAGGGYLKLALLTRFGLSPGSATSVVFMHTIEHGLFAAIAVPIALTVSGSWNLPIVATVLASIQARLITISVWTVATIVLVVLVSRLVARLSNGEDPLHRAMRRLSKLAGRLRHDFLGVYILIARRGKLRFAVSMTATALGDLCRFSVVLALFVGFGISIEPVLYWLLQWVVFAATVVVPMPGGAGGAEAAFFLVYGSSVPQEVLGLATVSWRFLSFYMLLIGGGIIFTVLSVVKQTAKPSITPPDLSAVPVPITSPYAGVQSRGSHSRTPA